MPDARMDFVDQLEAARSLIKILQAELETARKQLDLLREENKELERLAIIDELTKLYNQRHFYDTLQQEVAKNRGQKHPLCLLFFDVDSLKAYNDTHGHSGGNRVLRAVARSLSDNIEANPSSGYRYGGDEFAVILPETRAGRAIKIATRINRTLREAGFQDVTLSFGIAELSPKMDSQMLFKHADEAMYAAKKIENANPNNPIDKICVYNNGSNDVFHR